MRAPARDIIEGERELSFAARDARCVWAGGQNNTRTFRGGNGTDADKCVTYLSYIHTTSYSDIELSNSQLFVKRKKK